MFSFHLYSNCGFLALFYIYPAIWCLFPVLPSPTMCYTKICPIQIAFYSVQLHAQILDSYNRICSHPIQSKNTNFLTLIQQVKATYPNSLGGLKNTNFSNSTGAISNPRSLVNGHEMLRTVFVFAIAHLEGPPQAYAFYNGDIGGKISKISFWQ